MAQNLKTLRALEHHTDSSQNKMISSTAYTKFSGSDIQPLAFIKDKEITEEDIINGFEEKQNVYVTENGGQNRRKSAYLGVAFSFSQAK